MKNKDNNTINEAITTILKKGSQLSLPEILSLLKNYLPVYPSLRNSTKSIILDFFSSNLIGFSQLINFTIILTKDSPKESRIYKNIIVELLNERFDCLLNFIQNNTFKLTIELRNLKSLFFGSKIFNLIHEDIDIISYLKLLCKQWEVVFNVEEIHDLSIISDLLVSMLSLHPVYSPIQLFEGFFLINESRFQAFIEMIKKASSINKNRIINQYLLSYLDNKVSKGNMEEIFKILKNLPITNCFDLNCFNKFKSLIFQECVLKSISQSIMPSIMISLLNRFKEIDPMKDENICQLLVIILNDLMDNKHREKISCNSIFLESVTKRLASEDKDIRERTMFIAKIVTNGDLSYESDYTITIPSLNLQGIDTNIKNIDFVKLQEETQSIANNTEKELIPAINILSLDDTADSDDENDDDGRDIVFLKDLVKEFQLLNENRGKSKLRLLKLTIKLIRQKKDFGTEVKYYSSTLFAMIASLNNDIDEKNFEQWRMNTLETIVSSVPEETVNFIKFLFTTELSLQQRFSILSSLGLAARELRGIDDKMVLKPSYDFPTNRLPWDKGNESQLLETKSNNRIEEISEGRITWKSKKLQNAPQTKLNRFKPYARLFFYPLAHGWLNGINQGTYDKFFKTHYFSTLRMIYECADPVHDYQTMTDMMQQIIADAIEQDIPIDK
ncbi:hypothetical protein TBLA_0E00600 [Henningerozyma blattae CBS 6284]|uniref:Telomere length regulation protein conserved domain-containing protein n=1 Tax=Henningerozyma blattae (strain ATCC 34711 / CBS 6284 / DSM 70876 / NBRC 10599 / NRRL Y-10934 / UCD 77-7) TaxID=1071380 RepID=I2H419_HENB6|nr:hypothetical protein TBLA_0E00600 [Tetrapisispora blattae CBS 6284]CCH61121.1 hypothetical protein TBLA_0E00600 [Tetrapisispora blattae CBS 6284]